MVEVNKPDYLSLVNKGGSGFNVSELVDSIVASEIEPKRILQNSKKDSAENSISGIGFLSSQSNTTKNNFTTITSDKFFTPFSTNSASVALKATDEVKLTDVKRTIENVNIATKMVFEIGGFTSLTDTFSANLTIDYGTWSKNAAENSNPTNAYAAGKTYKVISEISDASDVSDIENNTSWTGGAASIPVGTTFTVNNNFSGTIDGAFLEEVDTYSFTDASNLVLKSLDFTDKTLNQVASLFNGVGGISAQVVDTNGDGSEYSLVLTSASVGARRGFKIEGDQRWSTDEIPSANSFENKFNVLAKDATFLLDGVSVTRNTNLIEDIIDGASIELNSDLSGSVSIGFTQSDTAIRQTVEDVIFSLNEFKTEIDRLTFIDIEGDENGPLAMDPSATSIKSKFKKLSVTPLAGFAEKAIYLSQLGIKTDNNGSYFLDDASFEKTLANNPNYFLALKDDNLSSNSPSVILKKSEFTTISAGNHEVTKVDGNWRIGDHDLLRVDYNGGSRFTTTAYPGLVIESAEVDPGDFTVYVGKSFSSSVTDLMSEILDFNSPIKSAEESYKNLSADIETRLQQLEEREKLITDRYTQQFGKMEQSMTQFNSTKTLLDNFIEAWKKQK